VRFREPAGGSGVWVELPAAVDARALAAEAAARGLAWSPGEAFHVDGDGPPALLLSFAAQGPDSIREGVGELAALVRRALAAQPARRSRG
jgi:DNA-binding transcriptional MocR family regulator